MAIKQISKKQRNWVEFTDNQRRYVIVLIDIRQEMEGVDIFQIIRNK